MSANSKYFVYGILILALTGIFLIRSYAKTDSAIQVQQNGISTIEDNTQQEILSPPPN